jgi:hypothetical protein
MLLVQGKSMFIMSLISARGLRCRKEVLIRMTQNISVESAAEHGWIIKSSTFHSFGSKRNPITFLQKYYFEYVG